MRLLSSASLYGIYAGLASRKFDLVASEAGYSFVLTCLLISIHCEQYGREPPPNWASIRILKRELYSRLKRLVMPRLLEGLCGDGHSRQMLELLMRRSILG